MEGKHLKPQKDRRAGFRTGWAGRGLGWMGARALMYAKVFHVENPHLAVLQEGKWKKELRFANTF